MKVNQIKKYQLCILYSGGIDSITAYYYAIKKLKYDKKNILLLMFDYGQPYFQKEYNLYKEISKFDENFIEINNVDNNLKVLKIDIEDESDNKNHYTMNRNVIFSSIAFRFANEVWLVANNDEYYTVDKNKHFFNEMTKLNSYTMDNPVLLHSPFINWSKTEIIKWGLEHQVPYFYSTSCYDSKKVACGYCKGCFYRYFDMMNNGVYEDFTYHPLKQDSNIAILKNIFEKNNFDLLNFMELNKFKKYKKVLEMTEIGRKLKECII